jgi:hypothetical protein
MRCYCKTELFVNGIVATGVDYFIVWYVDTYLMSKKTPSVLSFVRHKLILVVYFFFSRSNCACFIDVCSSLEREEKCKAERLQALKLVRCLVDVAVAKTPRSIVQSLVAVAEANDDSLRFQCLRVLCEIALRCPAVAAASNGIRTLVNAIVDPSLATQQPALIDALVYLLDGADTRQYVRANDVAVLLAPLVGTFRSADKVSDDERLVWQAVTLLLVLLDFSRRERSLTRNVVGASVGVVIAQLGGSDCALNAGCRPQCRYRCLIASSRRTPS